MNYQILGLASTYFKLEFEKQDRYLYRAAQSRTEFVKSVGTCMEQHRAELSLRKVKKHPKEETEAL